MKASVVDGRTASATVDGRTARRSRNRELVLDAALQLFAEGQLELNVDLVAERCGLSARSVFRYFDDTEDLLRSAIARHVDRVAPLFEVDRPGEGSLDERIGRFVDGRMRLYEAVAPTARAAVLRASTNNLIGGQLAAARRRLRQQLEVMFAPELKARLAPDRRATVAAADTLLQFEAVEHLRSDLGLSMAAVRGTLVRALTALLQL